MELISLSCNECGAPISVPESAKFVTCRHCGSQLAVKRTESAAYTEVIQEIRERTERLEQNMDQMRRYDEVEALDREWQFEREKFMVTGQNGHRSLPSTAGSLVGGVIAVVGGLGFVAFTSSIEGAGFFPLFGLLIVVVGVFASLGSYAKASDYQKALRRYRQRRKAALSQARRSSSS